MLTRKEMIVRKLLTKYHDDPEIIKRNRNIALFNFDPRRAERTRGKQIAAMSKEEKEWSSIDKVLHPEVIFLISRFHFTPRFGPITIMMTMQKLG